MLNNNKSNSAAGRHMLQEKFQCFKPPAEAPIPTIGGITEDGVFFCLAEADLVSDWVVDALDFPEAEASDE